MNFHHLYYQDPYASVFDAVVLSCQRQADRFAIRLSQTLFYPEGGGQSADTGVLIYDSCTVRVFDVQELDDAVIHYTKNPIPEGTAVSGRIDWEQRFERMQEHTGEHIISGLAHRAFGCENVGFHMSDVITLVLNCPITESQILEIERQANEIIFRNLPVEQIYPTTEELSHLDYRSKKELSGEVRLINIEDADSCACCGLHVRRTGEVGLVKILTCVNYKGGVRITMVAGRKAARYFDLIDEQNHLIAKKLSAKPCETASAVEHLLEASLEKDHKIAEIHEKYFNLVCAQIPNNTSLCLRFEKGLNQVELRKFCDRLVHSGKIKTAAVLNAINEMTFQYCIGSTTINLQAAAKELNAALSGRGGGKPGMIQGSFKTSEKMIRITLEDFFK